MSNKLEIKNKLANEQMLKTFAEKPLFAAQMEALSKSRRQKQIVVDEIAELTIKPKLICEYRNALLWLELGLLKMVLRQ